ncbi:hypothetical protein [Phycicoccus sonneratiae]|uniref:DUF2231 domain-containing protein n=1 Tax=Phycicoccus sonneratiae TaxID=2807628 RepID=A0ABS2CQ53_9MICO|nr:hypothetical protein [Phycicoccus sonneraticus]MBM6401563.1 hypothetical protein [Phycicoccus sonneraticus]
MTAWSTVVRATHLTTNAAWFGGSLMGAVGLNPAAEEGDDARERAAIADEGWTRWGPVQGAAVALHLLSGVAILADNRRRVRHHRPTAVAVLAKTALTGAAVALGAETYRVGAAFGEAREAADHDEEARAEARSLAGRLRRLQWVNPVLTGGLLVLDAYLGEQQRGFAGLLDRPSHRPG